MYKNHFFVLCVSAPFFMCIILMSVYSLPRYASRYIEKYCHFAFSVAFYITYVKHVSGLMKSISVVCHVKASVCFTHTSCVFN